MEDMRSQAKRFGTEIVNAYVHAVKLTEKPFRVYYADQEIEEFYLSFAKAIGQDVPIYLYNLPFDLEKSIAPTSAPGAPSRMPWILLPAPGIPMLPVIIRPALARRAVAMRAKRESFDR